MSAEATPEFSRVERLDAIGGEPRSVAIAAGAEERDALAARFALLAVEAIEADFAIRRDAAGVRVEGRVQARVVQPCAATGAPVPAAVDERVALLFVAPTGAGAGAGGEEEHELGADGIDTIELSGGGVDLGEVAAETMALALDPFPRAAGAEAVLRAAGVVGEDEAGEDAGPFGALAALRGRLGGEGG